jgi:cell division protease FtsH
MTAVPPTPGSNGSKPSRPKDAKRPAKARARFRLLPDRPGVAPLAVSLLVLLGIYAMALAILRPASPGREIGLDRLRDTADQGNVATARFLDEDARITGRLLTLEGDRVQYWASYPRSDAATSDLLQHLIDQHAHVSVDSQSFKALVRFLAQFLLPLVIFANLFALVFLLARPGGGGAEEFLSFSELGDKQLGAEVRSRANFSSVAGADEALVELSEVRDYLIDPESFARVGALPPKGVLISGPPGCGKTLLARAVAGEARASFYSISGSNFVESLVGVGAARVRDLFQQARANAPAIVFIDELDAVGRQRGAGLGGGNDEREQTLNEMLVQMDGFSPTEGVAVLAATNREDILDPALLRAGRFDRHITVERPDRDGRLAILRLHARGKRLADPEGDLPHVARTTPGFTGADLANLLNEAALLARRERSDAIVRPHLEEAAERVLAGPQRKGNILSAEERRRIAYHESGHAVVAAALGKAAMLHKLSTVARGTGVGHLAMLSEDKTIVTRSDLENQITIAMAGLAAEELALAEPSTGAALDLETATRTAKEMAGRYGMSPRLGRAQVLRQQGEVFLGRDYMAGQEISQPTLEHLDEEVRRILEEQEAVARSILSSNWELFEHLSSTLVARETLQGEDLEHLLARVPRHLNGGLELDGYAGSHRAADDGS